MGTKLVPSYGTIRAITNSKCNSHTTPLHKDLRLLKFEDNFKLSCLKFYHKYKQKQVPKYFLTMFIPGTQTTNSINSQPSRPRRNIRPPIRYTDTVHDLPSIQNDIRIETTNKKHSRACIRHIIPKLINEQYLPEIV